MMLLVKWTTKEIIMALNTITNKTKTKNKEKEGVHNNFWPRSLSYKFKIIMEILKRQILNRENHSQPIEHYTSK